MATKKGGRKLSKKAQRELKARALETRAAKTIVRAVTPKGAISPTIVLRDSEVYEVVRAAILAAVPGRQKYPNVERPLLDGTKAAAAAIRRVRRRVRGKTV